MNIWDACERRALERLTLPEGYVICGIALLPRNKSDLWVRAQVQLGYRVVTPNGKRHYVDIRTVVIERVEVQHLLDSVSIPI